MGIHDGHRDRLRSLFLFHGLDGFNDLNALELLLFYAIPRRDTNPIAHELLDRFGSLSGVFEASEQELCQISGLSKNAAALIMLVPQLMKKSMLSKVSDMKQILSSNDAGAYLAPHFINERDEILLLLCLDSQKRIIACSEVGRGIVNSVEANIRRIVETALKSKASSVIIAHNHPDSVALPSAADEYVTKQISASLSLVGISLADHIIVSGDDFVSFADSGMLPR